MFILDAQATCGDYALAHVLDLIRYAYQTICILVPIFLVVAATIQMVSFMTNPDQKDGEKKFGMKFVYAILIFLLPWITNFAIDFLKTSGLEISSVDVVACWNTGAAQADTMPDNEDVFIYNPPANSGMIGDLSALQIYAQNNIADAQSQAGGGSGGAILQGGQPVPIYYQGDYSDVVLGGSATVSNAGCGFTSVAMVISYLTDRNIDPRTMINEWPEARDYYTSEGMSWGLPSAAAQHYGVGSVSQTNSGTLAYRALQNGQVVISSQRNGIFNSTADGHIIVLRGLNQDGQVLVNDPSSHNAIELGYNGRAFDFESEIDATARQYWIFSKK